MVALTGTAQAALVNRGGGMVYDTVLNVTWLADANHALTSGYAAANAGGSGSNRIAADGGMGWDAARVWANSLDYGGFSDWRLPTLDPSDTTCSSSFNPGGGFPQQFSGFNCSAGELSHLYVVDLGQRAGQDVRNPNGKTATQLANLALFSANQAYLPSQHWSGTEYAPSPSDAWVFGSFGGQNLSLKDVERSGVAVVAMAVRSGDVVASVAEPQTLALALLALGATVMARRRLPD